MLPKVEESLQGAGDPASGLAQVASQVILRVAKDGYMNGIQDPAVIGAGGAAIIDDLAELSERLGIHQYSQEELDAVTKQVVQNVIKARAGQEGQPAEAGQPPAGQPAPAGPPAQGMMPPSGVQG
jgi:hypothetical protein